MKSFGAVSASVGQIVTAAKAYQISQIK